MNKRCPDCGVKVPVSAEVCPNCGYNFAENADENFPKDIGILGIQPDGPQAQETKPASKTSQPKSTAPKTEAAAQTEPIKSQVKAKAAVKQKTQPIIVKPKQVSKPAPSVAQTKPVTLNSEHAKKAQPHPVHIQPAAKSQPQARFMKEHHSVLPAAAPTREKRKQRASSRRPYHVFHVILGIIAAVIVVFAIFLAVGSHFYSKDRQVAQITQSLLKPETAVQDKLVTPDPSVKITSAAVKPLKRYYQQHPAALNRLQAKLKGKQRGAVRLVQTGEYGALFPKYALQLPVYELTVLTNQNKSNLAINGQIKGEMTERQGRYYQLKIGHQLPGLYHLTVQRGKQLKSKAVNLWSDRQVLLPTQLVKKKIPKRPHAKRGQERITAVMQRAFAAPQPDDFVRGTTNASYQALSAMHNSARSRNYRVSVKVNSVARILQRHYQVNYQVIYHFNSGRVRQQVMHYEGGILVKEKGRYQLQTMGSGHLMREN